MLRWALMFALLALVAGFWGFSGLAGQAGEFARMLFGLSLIAFVVVLALAVMRGRDQRG